MSEEDELVMDELARSEYEDQMGLGYPKSQEREGLFKFLGRVLRSNGNELSKVSNLKDYEIKSMQELRKGSIFCQVMGLDVVAAFFDAECDSYLSLGDSREGFLLNTTVTQKKEVGAKKGSDTGGKKPWFSR